MSTASQQQQEADRVDHHSASTKVWVGGNKHLNTLPLTSRFTSFTLSSRTSQTLLSAVSKHKTTLAPFLQTLLAASIFSAVPEDYDGVLGQCSFSLRPHLEEFPEDAMGLFVSGCGTEYLRERLDDNGAGLGSDGVGTLTTWVGFWNEVDRTKRSLLAAINTAVESPRVPETDLAGKDVDKLNAMTCWMKGLINSPRVASFDINNLGRFNNNGRDDSQTTLESEASHISIGRVIFSASQSAMGSALKVNVVTGPRGDMTFGFAWQNEVHDEQVVCRIVDTFRREIELMK